MQGWQDWGKVNQCMFYRRWTGLCWFPPGESREEDNAGTDNMNIIPIYVICITRQGSILSITLYFIKILFCLCRVKGFPDSVTLHILLITCHYPSLVKSSPLRHSCQPLVSPVSSDIGRQGWCSLILPIEKENTARDVLRGLLCLKDF